MYTVKGTERDKEALEDEQEWEEINTHRPEGMSLFPVLSESCSHGSYDVVWRSKATAKP